MVSACLDWNPGPTVMDSSLAGIPYQLKNATLTYLSSLAAKVNLSGAIQTICSNPYASAGALASGGFIANSLIEIKRDGPSAGRIFKLATGVIIGNLALSNDTLLPVINCLLTGLVLGTIVTSNKKTFFLLKNYRAS
jgi:hypothetical protein